MNALVELSNNVIFHYGLIFCRIGAIMLFIPGFGESYVSARSRLTLALLLCLILFPVVTPTLPPMPQDILHMFLIMAGEITVGIFIGLAMRIIQAVLHVAGMMIAFMCGLSTATLFDANQSTQGSVIGGFLAVVGITLFFTSGLHHMVFRGVGESFTLIKAGEMVPLADFAEMAASLVSQIFYVAFKIAAPVMLVGLMLYLSAGLMGRLMPTMQVFFILMPVQILVGFLFMGMALSGMMLVYLNFFEEKLLELF